MENKGDKKMKTEKEKMLNGELYNAADSELVKERENARRLTRLYNQTLETKTSKRTEILKELFGSIRKNIYIEPNLRCDYGYNIHVGENFMLILIVHSWIYVKSG